MKIKIRYIEDTTEDGIEFCTANTPDEIKAVVSFVKENGFYHTLGACVIPYLSYQLCCDDSSTWVEIIIGKEKP